VHHNLHLRLRHPLLLGIGEALVRPAVLYNGTDVTDRVRPIAQESKRNSNGPSRAILNERKALARI
jgi:hypothetical protein